MNDADLVAWLLLLLRVASSLVALAPFTQGPIPAPVKIGFAVALTLAWAPDIATTMQVAILPALQSSLPGWQLGWLAVREVLTGLAIAWVLSLWFVPLRVAGAYIGQEMGLSLGGLTSPVDQQQSTVVTQLLEALGLLAFFCFDLHHLLLWTQRRTLDLFPVAGSGPIPGAGWIVRSVSAAERVGLELAAPIGVGLFLLLIVTLLINRSVPQLNLLSFGTPLRLAVGLGLLLLGLPGLLQRFLDVVATVGSAW